MLWTQKDGITAACGELQVVTDPVTQKKTLTVLHGTDLRITQDGVNQRVIGANGVISAINQTAESVKIQAGKINLEGYVTATELGVTDAKIENLKSGRTEAFLLWATTLRCGTLRVGASTYGAANLIVDGESAGAVLSTSGNPISISHQSFTGCTQSTSGGTVTLTFTRGVGDPVSVSFEKGGQASSVSLSAISSVRETQEGSGVWLADTTVSLNGTTATKTLDVTAAISRGYALGWAAARARAGFSWSGANQNVLTINRPGAGVDTSDPAVVYSIGSYKASGDKLVNSAANYFTYNGTVYTTVTPQNDPEHAGQWTPGTVHVTKTQYINVGQ